ncbi:MAG TPA: phosphoribosylformylglycinamidine synthase I [Planctomycetota bacterium]|nr:phosphoribosylformylglycinamidine synthase I [Planctomycetota bacterium]
MTTPAVLVLRAAGTNCERETAYAFERFGARATISHVNRLLESPDELQRHHVLALPGGFAYGDDAGAGAVLACEMRSRLNEPLRRFVAEGGLVLGICNGFQALVRLGLLPGLDDVLGVQEVSLADNDSLKYEDRWVRLQVTSRRCVFVGDMPAPELPLAHGEGKLVPRDAQVRARLAADDRVVFRYVDEQLHPTQHYPENPNGSTDAIAGLTDRTGRVLGLMPHPERALFGYHHPAWTRQGARVPDLGPGAPLFANACDWVRAQR